MAKIFRLGSIVGAVTLALASLVSSASAEHVVLITGKEGGGYDASARETAARLQQRGHTTEIINLAGSDEITLRACNTEGPVMWWAQKDALWKRETGGTACSLVDLAIYGTEYAMLFAPPDSDISKIGHLTAESRVLVDTLGSGSELTFKNLQHIEVEHGRSDTWSKAQREAKTVRRATSMAKRNQIHAALVVRTTTSKDIDLLLDNGWEMISLKDKDIDDLVWGGSPLYTKVKLTIIRNGRRAAKNVAYEVPSFIGTTPQVERDYPELFDDMLDVVE